uniref:Uncharacterized protein n=1 Tax=Vitis vinifera TaxID=29760 RepID=A5C0G8_VITVI|nr:hypothetical protein VITISV_041737 [Vitis vinifera]
MSGRAQKKKGQERVRWSPDEDKRLAEYIDRHGEPSSWKNVPTRAGLSRPPNICRLRWITNLKPSINQKPFSEEEKATIIELQKQHGNEWETIAQKMSGRTATKIKNFWNSHQRKDPQVCPRNPDGIGFGPASIPNASSIPAPVSASLEPSKADQAVKNLEVTQLTKKPLTGLWMMRIVTVHGKNFGTPTNIDLLHSDGSYNIIN